MIEKRILVFVLENGENAHISNLLSALSTDADPIHIQNVTSTEAALALLQEEPFTMIFLGLPINHTIGDGLNLLLQMHQLKPEVPIIVLVNQKTMGLGLQALEFGAFAYYSSQHVTAQSLRQIINRATAKQKILQAAQNEGGLDNVLFHSFPACVVVLNELGQVTAVNQEWQLLGQETNDPLITQTQPGVDFLQLCRQIKKPDIAIAVTKVLEGKQAKYTLEYPWKQDGIMIWRMICITALRWPQGGAILTIQEVTDIVVNQIQLSTYEDHITKLQSNVITLVHELRAPLTSMRLYLDLAKRADAAKRKHYLSVLKQEIIHMEQFVDEILTLSRLEEVKEAGLYRPVNFGDLVEHVVLVQQPVAAAKEIALTLTAVPDTLFVQGRPRQLTRVITNLLSNAIRYTKAGEVRVSVARDDATHHIVLTVADSGMGIDPTVLPHIFEPFFRSPRAQNTAEAGTGLGLAIVQRIVALHDGYIEVTSELNKGTVFRIFLPALDPSEIG